MTTSIAYGSYAILKGHTAVSGVTDTLAYDIRGSYLHSKGYRDNSDSIAKDFGANLRVDPSDRFTMHLSTGYHYDDTRNPGRLFQTDIDAGLSRTDTATPDDFSKVDDCYINLCSTVIGIFLLPNLRNWLILLSATCFQVRNS